MLTATFYGLSISLSCFLLAIYVYVTGDSDITVMQGFIFALSSGIFAYFLPKWLTPNTKALQSGLDAHL